MNLDLISSNDIRPSLLRINMDAFFPFSHPCDQLSGSENLLLLSSVSKVSDIPNLLTYSQMVRLSILKLYLSFK